jgi:hypothetical protein
LKNLRAAICLQKKIVDRIYAAIDFNVGSFLCHERILGAETTDSVQSAASSVIDQASFPHFA